MVRSSACARAVNVRLRRRSGVVAVVVAVAGVLACQFEQKSKCC